MRVRYDFLMRSKEIYLGIPALILLLVSRCGRQIANRNSAGQNIICFGDSLTAGEGAGAGEDYPSVLGKLLGQEVINAGVSGDTSRDGLERLERDVLSRNPKLVIIEFGANDFFQQISRQETIGNLEKMVDSIQAAGAACALVEVRMAVVSPYLADLKRISREKKTLLIPNILQGILSDPGLKSDQLHPNRQGYELMARRIHRQIKPYL